MIAVLFGATATVCLRAPLPAGGSLARLGWSRWTLAGDGCQCSEARALAGTSVSHHCGQILPLMNLARDTVMVSDRAAGCQLRLLGYRFSLSEMSWIHPRVIQADCRVQITIGLASTHNFN